MQTKLEKKLSAVSSDSFWAVGLGGNLLLLAVTCTTSDGRMSAAHVALVYYLMILSKGSVIFVIDVHTGKRKYVSSTPVLSVIH